MEKNQLIIIAVIAAAAVIGVGVFFAMQGGNNNSGTDEYTVTFDVQGHGTAPDTQKVKSGGTVTKPADPTATGYSFGGWYKESACTNVWNFKNDKVTQNTTLYAKWDPAVTTYTVTFDVQGHGTAPASQTIDYGGKVNMPAYQTQDGWALCGWYEDSTCMNVWNFSTDTVTKDTTLYAKWQQATYQFYFSDNFVYDGFVSESVQFPIQPYTSNPGVWVLSNSTAGVKDAFEDACKIMYGNDVTIGYDADGRISQIGEVETNLFLEGWNGTEWVGKDASGYLGFNSDLSAYTDFAIVHGACEGSSGDAPYPRGIGFTGKDPAVPVQVTPQDRTWYYGDTSQHKEGSKILFYVYDNFIYANFVSEREDASDPETLLVTGIWVAGYADQGQFQAYAFADAMERLGYEFEWNSIDNPFIRYINQDPSIYDGNFCIASWDEEYAEQETHWNQNFYLSTTYVDQEGIMYDICGTNCVIMAIGHGEWDEGSAVPPLATWLEPSDCDWYF